MSTMLDPDTLRCLNGPWLLVRADDRETPVSERWDAGETGCGELVLELSVRLRKMQPGDDLEVIVRDPGAPTDLPAWCRMTGHTLVSARHPTYVIRRRAD